MTAQILVDGAWVVLEPDWTLDRHINGNDELKVGRMIVSVPWRVLNDDGLILAVAPAEIILG